MANKQMSTLTIGENAYEIVDATARANKIDKTNLVQTTGTATDKVMSQNAVTQAINAASSGASIITINVESATSGTFTDEQMAQLADENSIIKAVLTNDTYSEYLTLHQVVNNLDEASGRDYEYAAVVGNTVHRVTVIPGDPNAGEPTPNTWIYTTVTIGGTQLYKHLIYNHEGELFEIISTHPDQITGLSELANIPIIGVVPSQGNGIAMCVYTGSSLLIIQPLTDGTTYNREISDFLSDDVYPL